MQTAMDHDVRQRAADICEYCHLPENVSELPHVIDHVIARQHKGETNLENLALCCGRCNSHKGPNIAGIDPVTRKLVRLFNPRTDRWEHHFSWQTALLGGLTPIGRATIEVLAINHPYRVAVRKLLMAAGKL
jgi:5-methylcytosine-specific restriction endonuclease McrA